MKRHRTTRLARAAMAILLMWAMQHAARADARYCAEIADLARARALGEGLTSGIFDGMASASLGDIWKNEVTIPVADFRSLNPASSLLAVVMQLRRFDLSHPPTELRLAGWRITSASPSAAATSAAAAFNSCSLMRVAAKRVRSRRPTDCFARAARSSRRWPPVSAMCGPCWTPSSTSRRVDPRVPRVAHARAIRAGCQGTVRLTLKRGQEACAKPGSIAERWR